MGLGTWHQGAAEDPPSREAEEGAMWPGEPHFLHTLCPHHPASLTPPFQTRSPHAPCPCSPSPLWLWVSPLGRERVHWPISTAFPHLTSPCQVQCRDSQVRGSWWQEKGVQASVQPRPASPLLPQQPPLGPSPPPPAQSPGTRMKCNEQLFVVQLPALFQMSLNLRYNCCPFLIPNELSSR